MCLNGLLQYKKDNNNNKKVVIGLGSVVCIDRILYNYTNVTKLQDKIL